MGKRKRYIIGTIILIVIGEALSMAAIHWVAMRNQKDNDKDKKNKKK